MKDSIYCYVWNVKKMGLKLSITGIITCISVETTPVQVLTVGSSLAHQIFIFLDTLSHVQILEKLFLNVLWVHFLTVGKKLGGKS